MNITLWALRNKTTVTVTTGMVILCGVLAYFNLGKLKDPTFTIQTAVVMTEYPGASPSEVELQVTEVIEKAVQKMGSLDKVRSMSQQGLSTVFVDIKPAYPPEAMPQVWNELREEIEDAGQELPQGAGPSFVIDHFGETYGVFLALTGDGFSMSELGEYAEYMQKHLKLCTDVADVTLFGVQPEEVVIEVSKERLADFEVNPESILMMIGTQNTVMPFGYLNAGDYQIPILPTGNFASVEEIEDLVLRAGTSNPLLASSGNAAAAGSAARQISNVQARSTAGDQMFRLGDIAEVNKAYVEPPQVIMRYNGKPAIGIGVSTVKHGNAVVMGKAVLEKIQEMTAHMPAGLEIGFINYQAKNVTEAVNSFILALVEAVVIVLVVLTLALGVRSAVVISNGLVFNICATLIVMWCVGIDLQIISISALIIVIGMLVDDSVVVADNIKVRLEQGESPESACMESAQATAWPQLVATSVIIFSVLPFKLAKCGEAQFDETIFDVMLIALAISWMQAMTAVPVLGVQLFKVNRDKDRVKPEKNYDDSRFYRAYRRILETALHHRWFTLLAVIMVLLASFGAFDFVKQEFVPLADRAQFQIDYWLPEGTRIERTSADLAEIEKEVLSWPGVESVMTSVGSGPPRFLLTFQPEQPNSAYGILVVNTKDKKDVDGLIERARTYLAQNFPDAEPRVERFNFANMLDYLIQVRFSGDDPQVLRAIAEKAKAIMAQNPMAKNIHDDWRQRVPVWEPEFSQTAGALSSITRPAVSATLISRSSGLPVGTFREGNKKIPIVLRMPPEAREDNVDLETLPVWDVGPYSVPMASLMESGNLKMRDPIIRRYNRIPTITVQCNPKPGTTSVALRSELVEKIEAIPLPPGYSLAWGGVYADEENTNAGFGAYYPLAFVLMFLAVVLLFNGVRQVIIIFLALPVAIVGVTIGLLVSDKPYGFMALGGVVALMGIMVRSKVILITEMDHLIRQGLDRYQAVVRAAITRVRPVLVTTFCTVFGMIPLVSDNLFGPMAVTIMGGLLFATFITLVLIPVLYAVFYRIEAPPRS